MEALFALLERGLYLPRLVVEAGVFDGNDDVAGHGLKEIQVALDIGFAASLVAHRQGPLQLPLVQERNGKLGADLFHGR